MRTRFGLDVADVNLETFDDTSLPKERSGVVFKILKDFLKNVKDVPEWFQSWKDKRNEEMKRRLAGSADDKSGGKATAEEAANQSAAEDKKDDDKEDAVVAATASDAAKGLFKVGDHVMGVAKRYRGNWAHECVITGVLTKHYKVKMLSGDATGENHKFTHKDVKAIPSAAFAASVAKSVAKSDAASDAGSTSAPAPKQEEESGMQDIANLFDE